MDNLIISLKEMTMKVIVYSVEELRHFNPRAAEDVYVSGYYNPATGNCRTAESEILECLAFWMILTSELHPK